MKIYLASSWRNEHYTEVLDRLREEGFDVYDFRNEDTAFHWRSVHAEWKKWDLFSFVQALETKIAIRGFASDLSAMRRSDVCVLLLPCGRSAHLEAGWFVGKGKQLFILVPEDIEPELMYSMADGVLGSVEDLVIALRAPQKRLAKEAIS